ncbi:sulfatase [Natronomonas sp. EA1]|uniref:sulfatase n=1 Tax=Natronomonas sp. EA1 TaxID=3421655 RepID=UPI003EC004D2
MSNVVLVTVDSLRADHLAGYGYHRETAPFVETLADRGVSFDAYANANATRASFPSIITSSYPLEHGGFDYLSDSRVTVGEALPDHHTAAFHSNLWLSRDYNYDRGFDTFYDSKSEPSPLARLRTWLKLNLNQDGLVYRTLQTLYDTTEEKAGMDIGQTYKDAAVITDRAIEWLESSVEAGNESFLWVHYMDVHHPYVPRPEALSELGIDLAISENEAIKLRRKMLETPEAVTDDEVQTLVDLYDGEIRYMDHHIRRLCEAVEDAWGLNDTAVVFTADHGEEFKEHGKFSHNDSMYDEVIHVPFIVEGADRVGVSDISGRQAEQVELLDTAPTICHLAGVDAPEAYRGRSVLDRAGTGEHARVFSETTSGDDAKVALRTHEHKYIWDRPSDERELYDLAADPGETENIVGEEPTEELHDEVAAHLAEIRETNEELPEVGMDVETEQRLRNLGYLD